jgi:hypothetical protein
MAAPDMDVCRDIAGVLIGYYLRILYLPDPRRSSCMSVVSCLYRDLFMKQPAGPQKGKSDEDLMKNSNRGRRN